MKKVELSKLSILLLTSILLTSCGGGGGTTSVKANAGFSDVSNSRYDVAAKATPKEGSVIQSTNTDPSLGVDTTKTTLAFKQVAGGEEVGFSSSDSIFSTTEIIDGVTTRSNIYKKSVTGGDFYVVSGVSEYGTNDEDYLSYGLWAYTPSTGDAEVGFYTDGGDPFTQANIAALTGTATYTSTDAVTGFFRGKNDRDVYVTDVATGEITLAANFDTDKISGEITGINFETIEVPAGLKIALQAANIDNTKVGGFWTGDTLTTNTDNAEQYIGKWGGQFYGNGDGNPKFAAGTFGGAAAPGTGAEGTFVGSFVAKKQ
jgi:hypothetical protein